MKSMTDFVLNEFELLDNIPTQTLAIKHINRIKNYAKFLKQPLTLGMFVPCDEDDNFVEEPKPIYSTQNLYEDSEPSYDKKEVENYKKAIERVIFNGFEVIHNDKVRITIECNHFQLDFNKPLNQFENCKTIEDLVRFNLDLAVSF